VPNKPSLQAARAGFVRGSKSEKLLTAYEIAAILNISKAKATQFISTGEIPSVQFDRTTKVREQDLEKILKDPVVHAV